MDDKTRHRQNIDERKNPGASPSENEEIYRSIFESLTDVYYRADHKGRVTIISPSVRARAGYDPEDIIGKHVTDFYLNPSEGETFKKTLRKCGEVIDYEMKLMRKDGKVLDVSTSSRLIYGSDGSLVGEEGVLRDISERKKAESALHESEEKHRTIFESANDAIFLMYGEKFIECNRKTLSMFGCDEKSDILGHSPFDYSPEYQPDGSHSKDKALEYITAAVGGKPQIFEWQHIRKDGAHFDVEVSLNRLVLGGKWHLQAVVRDITAQKKAEETLRTSEEKFSKAFMNNPDSIYLTTIPDGKFVDVNPAFEKTSGYKKDEVLGKSALELQFYITPEDRIQLMEHLKKEGRLQDYEISFRVKSGEILLCRVFSEIFAVQGIPHLLSIVRDITEQKKAELALKKSYRKLKKAIYGNIQLMATTVEVRDPYTAGHQKRVAELARSIATEMALSEEQVEGIYQAGGIHDLGKISVPSEILSKPGRLSPLELNLIKTHPQVGFDILKEIEFPWPIAQMIYQHHERMDGTGYPQGLCGDDILFEARIIGIADVVEAMVSHRPYRPALGIDVALEEIKKNKGILYDSRVADACLKLFMEKKFTFTDTGKE